MWTIPLLTPHGSLVWGFVTYKDKYRYPNRPAVQSKPSDFKPGERDNDKSH